MDNNSLQTLKNNGFLIFKTAKGIQVLLGDPKNEQANLIADKISDFQDRVVVLIHDIAQLYDYVIKIPEIAWDLIDFAERPLTVIFPAGKNLPQPFMKPNGKIAVRLVKEGGLLNLARNYRKALFYLPLPTDFELDQLQNLNYSLEIGKEFQISEKTMLLELNGEFKFI